MANPLPPADDDVAAAVAAKWNADPQLPKLVPGGLQRGRLSSFQPGVDSPRVERKRPYATFAVKKAADGIHQTGGDYIDRRAATIKVYGLEAEVAGVLAYARSAKVFNRQTLATQALFMGCLQDETDDVEQDKDAKKGEDWWIGTIALTVMTQRSE